MVDGGGLENRRSRKASRGSNPFLSAILRSRLQRQRELRLAGHAKVVTISAKRERGPQTKIRNPRRVSLHDHPGIDLGQVETEHTLARSRTHVVRRAESVVIEFSLNLHLRVVTDGTFVEDGADGELRGCHGVCIVVHVS